MIPSVPQLLVHNMHAATRSTPDSTSDWPCGQQQQEHTVGAAMRISYLQNSPEFLDAWVGLANLRQIQVTFTSTKGPL